jgi:hypothetical protein
MVAGGLMVKALPPAMCAKRTTACIRASCRGWSSFKPPSGSSFQADDTSVHHHYREAQATS